MPNTLLPSNGDIVTHLDDHENAHYLAVPDPDQTKVYLIRVRKSKGYPFASRIKQLRVESNLGKLVIVTSVEAYKPLKIVREEGRTLLVGPYPRHEAKQTVKPTLTP